MSLHDSEIVRSVSGSEKKCEIEFSPELLDTNKLKDKVNKTINASGLDVTLEEKHLEDGVLVLMIGVIQAAANAVRNLILEILHIMAQCA